MKSNYVSSISPQTQKEYIVPDEVSEKNTIDEFLERNSGKEIVVVQGLGFVGAVMSIVCSNALNKEYAVIGIDLPTADSYWKIGSIRDGEFPIKSSDPKVDEFFKLSQKKGNFLATFHPHAYSKAGVIIIDINLDVEKESDSNKDLIDYGVNLDGFKAAITSVSINCKKDVLVLVETTVPPGTTEKVVYPILESGIRERGLTSDRFKLGHSYERVMPGPNYIDSIQNFYRVYSGVNEDSADAIEEFLRTIVSTDKYPLTRLKSTNSTEMAKVLENSFRAMNIAFIVEWSRFAEEAGVNLFDVVNAIRMRPTHKNMMLPGIGVGGYCLTKDPLLASWSRREMFGSDVGLGQSEMGVKINDKMPQYAFQYLVQNYRNQLTGKKVLLLGVSYLNDVGDTRYTPVDHLYDLLIEAGAVITCHDPYVNYWEEKDITIEADLEKILSTQYDIIVISTGHSIYKNNHLLIDRIVELKNVFVLDTINIFTSDEIKQITNKHVLKVIGRGDL
jgi:UDP-N-acetyl-D-glucosamine dehydrogenase